MVEGPAKASEGQVTSTANEPQLGEAAGASEAGPSEAIPTSEAGPSSALDLTEEEIIAATALLASKADPKGKKILTTEEAEEEKRLAAIRERLTKEQLAAERSLASQSVYSSETEKLKLVSFLEERGRDFETLITMPRIELERLVEELKIKEQNELEAQKEEVIQFLVGRGYSREQLQPLSLEYLRVEEKKELAQIEKERKKEAREKRRLELAKEKEKGTKAQKAQNDKDKLKATLKALGVPGQRIGPMKIERMIELIREIKEDMSKGKTHPSTYPIKPSAQPRNKSEEIKSRLWAELEVKKIGYSPDKGRYSIVRGNTSYRLRTLEEIIDLPREVSSQVLNLLKGGIGELANELLVLKDSLTSYLDTSKGDQLPQFPLAGQSPIQDWEYIKDSEMFRITREDGSIEGYLPEDLLHLSRFDISRLSMLPLLKKSSGQLETLTTRLILFIADKEKATSEEIQKSYQERAEWVRKQEVRTKKKTDQSKKLPVPPPTPVQEDQSQENPSQAGSAPTPLEILPLSVVHPITSWSYYKEQNLLVVHRGQGQQNDTMLADGIFVLSKEYLQALIDTAQVDNDPVKEELLQKIIVILKALDGKS